MKDILMSLVVTGLVAGMIAACASPVPAQNGQQQTTGKSIQYHLLYGSVFRTIDDEAGVVCYSLSNDKGAGIDCIPLSETRLGR
jgi:hypothetical protein